MDASPDHINLDEIDEEIRKIKFVKDVHDIHISSMSFEKYNMTCHILCSEHPEYVLKKVTKMCRKYGIYHSTIQVEVDQGKF